MKVLACNAPFNEGGMGKFLAELIEDARRTQTLERYFCTLAKSGDARGQTVSLQRWRPLFRCALVHHDLARREFLAADLFDRAVAKQLARSETFVGFGGRTLHSFRRARRLNYDELVLESATSHVANVRKQHALARRHFGEEASWLGDAQFEKTMCEYQLADRIVVTSEYSMRTFLAAGINAAKLERRFQNVAPRFVPPPRFVPAPHFVPPQRVASEVFTMIYVGRLEATKGVPLLLQAFSQLNEKNISLILVGGFASDAMEKLVRTAQAKDARILLTHGDPLPFLHRADLLVHPSYEDGLALAPLEALACGVPVVVSEDTGMKEFVSEANGKIVPTGDLAALVESLRSMMCRPLKGTFAPFSV